MSTRSAIIEKLPDGTYRGIYCHNDGYLKGVGKVLQTHYNEKHKVSSLISLGDLSCCYQYIGTDLKHSFDRPQRNVTIAYHRDRGEDKRIVYGKTSDEVADQIDHNGHVYVFEDKWYHNGNLME